MSNRQKQRPCGRREPKSPAAAMFRRGCPDCLSPNITWMGLGEAFDRLGGQHVGQLLSVFDAEPGSFDPDFWICENCGETGAFGPMFSS